MKYIKKFNLLKEENNTDNIQDELDDIKNMFFELSDKFDYYLEFNLVEYHKWYPDDRDTRVIDGVSVYIEDHPVKVSNIIPILRKAKIHFDCEIDVDPENDCKEYLSLDEFEEDYGGDELETIDIIIYRN